jgi:hypothetical protein
LVLLSGFSEAMAKLSTQFYGHTFTYKGQLTFISSPSKGITQDNLITGLAKEYSNFLPLGRSVENFARRHQFTDWARVMLAYKVVRELYPHNQKDQVVGMVLMLRTIGLNAQIFNNKTSRNESFLIGIECDKPIYNGVVFMFKDKRFGLFDLKKGELLRQTLSNPKGYFYDLNAELGQSCRAIKLVPGWFPSFPERPVKMTRKWTYQKKSYSLSYAINQNLVDFLKSHPQIHLSHYFNYPISETVYYNILKPLRQEIEENRFSESEAVAFLMAFHHQAFRHRDDMKTPMGEHTNFVEETLLSRVSDCEDQSVLFAALLRGVLGYEVLGLEYPNHVSVAVYNEQLNANGHVLKVNGKRYIEADPSYVGSRLGMVQPDLKNISPQIIVIGKLRIVK